MKVKFSNNYEAKKKRIQRLPELFNDIMMGAVKKDAIGLIETFQDGIRNMTFDLVPLGITTIKRKAAQGMTLSDHPLYGKGDERKDDSYINLLRIRKLKKGWKVYPSWKKHWSGKISLRDLFTIHEYGTKIVKKNGTIIIIPERPAFLKAYRKWMLGRSESKRETSKEVKAAIIDFIEKADTGRARRFINVKKKGIEE